MKQLRVVIVEDEAATARSLARQLQTAGDDIVITALLSSVAEGITWFNAHQEDYDLIFMDIRLADGISFDIFKKAPVNKPVIFVTAYNDYAIQAFKNNGIDYILKPFDEDEINRALVKFRNLTAQSPVPHQPADDRLARMLRQMDQMVKPHKRSFLLHFRDKLIPVETARIAWFYTANEVVYARTIDDRQFIMEFTMEQLEQQLDPSLFFRANRQFIINRNAITEVDFFFNSRLSVKIKPEPAERILISKARVPEFKIWMNS